MNELIIEAGRKTPVIYRGFVDLEYNLKLIGHRTRRNSPELK
jgi:hypothetical protein